jgi:hypothetical protein
MYSMFAYRIQTSRDSRYQIDICISPVPPLLPSLLYNTNMPIRLPPATTAHAVIARLPYAKNVGLYVLAAAAFELELPPRPVADGGVPLPFVPTAFNKLEQVLAVVALWVVALPLKLHASARLLFPR